MTIENQPLGGDDDDFSDADFGNDLNPPANSPADPPPTEPAGDPLPDPAGGSPADGDQKPPVDGEGEGEADAEGNSVPYGRFKEVNDAKKTLATQLAERDARIAELEAARNPPANPPAGEDPMQAFNDELNGLYEKVEELRLDGETKQAAQVQRQIDAMNSQLLLAQSRQVAKEATSGAKLAERYNSYLDSVEATFPELTKGSDTFDADKVADVNLTAQAYEKAGMHPLDAIQKAVKLVMGETVEARQSKAAAPPPPVAPAAPATKTRDLNKAVDAANRQPPDMSTTGVNKDDTKINISQLSDEEFDKLPLTKQREMRGDFA